MIEPLEDRADRRRGRSPPGGRPGAVAICLLSRISTNHEARSRRGSARRFPGSTSPRRTRYCRSSASTSAAHDQIDAYLSPARPLSRPARGDRDRARAPGAARDAVLGGLARGRGGAGGRVERSVRPRAGRSRRAARGISGAGTRSGSTWRDLVRRLRRRRRSRAADRPREIEGRVLQRPMVDVHTVGAGGGRSGGGTPRRLRVGPHRRAPSPTGELRARRERADGHRRKPGARLPRGGLDLAGGVELDPDRARRRSKARRRARPRRAGDREGIVRVANQEMIRALRVVTVERGSTRASTR